MCQCVAAEDGAGTVKGDGRAVELGDAAAGLGDEQRAARVVPRLEDALEAQLDPASGDVGQIEGG